MNIVFEVIMVNEHCPSETCSFGIYTTREKAEDIIAKNKHHYSDYMSFEIEEKYMVIQ